MNMKELKALRTETGASLFECKQALKSCGTFDEAVVMAKRLAAEREAKEAQDEAGRAQQRQASYEEAELRKKKEAFIQTMKLRFGLSPNEVEALLEQEGGDTERVMLLGAEIRREKARQYQLEQDAKLDKSGWSMNTSFRSDMTFFGSSNVIIGFECVQGTRVEFRLNMKDGLLDRLSNWTEQLVMPGQEPDDPEPLGVWWIYSEDRRCIINMHSTDMDDVYIDDFDVDESDYPEVSALLKKLTNAAVRDMWIEG